MWLDAIINDAFYSFAEPMANMKRIFFEWLEQQKSEINP